MIEQKFKIGDEVRLVSRNHDLTRSNPPEGSISLTARGVVFDTDNTDTVAVDFGNGRDEWVGVEDLCFAGSNIKDTNPKDAVGIRKPPMSTVSAPVLQEVGVAMMEGARKYGRHNYRVSGVRSSVYYDASLRHLMAFWEGEDTDPDSGINHISKAIAGLCVLRDSFISGIVVDDRPPRVDLTEHKQKLQELVDELFERHPEPKEAYTHE